MMKIDDFRNELDKINHELAQWTGKPELSLHYQNGETREDTLFLYGIVGGKDVGKTSLINQLAGARISIDTDLLDEGTNRGVAYCHELDKPILQKRFTGEIGKRVEYVTHDRDVLRNVVLLDFPDFDSRFAAHRKEVKHLCRFLQGLVWVITPRKYGDHEFIDQLESVAQSHENYFIILNKADTLENRVNLESARQEVLNYLQDECGRRGIAKPTGDRLMLISALNPEQYEFPRLHERIIRRHSLDEILKAKVKNLRTEFHKNLQRMRAYYAFQEQIHELDHILEEIAEALRTQFDESYFQTVRQRVLALDPIQQRISHGLFVQRVQYWPILRLLFYPLAGLVSFIGGRMAFSKNEELSESPSDLLRRQGQTASSRLQTIWSDITEKHREAATFAGDPPSFRETTEDSFRRMLDIYEDRVIQRVSSGIQPPPPALRTLAFLPLVWFPIVQPLLVHWLRSDDSLLSLKGIGGTLAALIALFGAGALLEAVIFLLVFYTIWLVLLYSRGARHALLEGHEEFNELWTDDFLPNLTLLLSSPFAKIRSNWINKQQQLEAIQTNIDTELLRIEQSK